jgi:hypothetical protein
VNCARLQIVLISTLLAAACFAAWAWLRPYDRDPDPAARCEIESVKVSEDHGYYWVEVFLKTTRDESFDPTKPVKLETADGREISSADLHFAPETGNGGLRFKFWLEARDISGRLALRINDGKLVIKLRDGKPELGSAGERSFTTSNW